MVEDPKFDYKYDLALWKSFSARLSVAILVIAAGVFLIAMLTYLYYSEEQVKEELPQRVHGEIPTWIDYPVNVIHSMLVIDCQ